MGTPSGVLVSEDGKIVSEVAVGAAQVLALLAGPHTDLDELDSAPSPHSEALHAKYGVP
jgi:hypothetical protein